MKEERLYVLVEKELAGSLSDTELTELQQGLDGDSGNLAAYEEVKTILVATSDLLGGIDPQTDSAWAALQETLVEDGVEETPATVIPMRRKRFGWVAVAAAVAILAMVGFYFADPSGPQVDPANAPMAYTVGNGKTLAMTLPDESRIILNAGSKLELAEDFGKTTRTVRLEGEGFFDIARDESKPFIIRTPGETETRVLGTSFNIQAYPGQENVGIDVMSGKVSFSSMASGKSVQLVAEQGARCRIADGEVEMMDSEAVNTAEWRRGKLVFKGAPLVDALVILEKHYDLEFEVAPEAQAEVLTATYDPRSIDEEKLLNNLRTTLGVNIEKEGRRVYIAN